MQLNRKKSRLYPPKLSLVNNSLFKLYLNRFLTVFKSSLYKKNAMSQQRCEPMAIKKGKKEKLAIVPKERAGMVTRRPHELMMDMNDFFDSFRSNFDELFWGPGESIMASPDYRMPVMDVVDLGDKYQMHVEMPGIKKEDVSIEVTPTMVEICAEHEESSEDKGKNWLRQERSSMDFYRRLELPEDVKTENVDAELKNGVLTLSLPKAKPKPTFEAKKVKIK
jgi:HSP20 family protein